jgi:hypothetical protein
MGAHLTGGASPQPERGVARSYSVAVPPPAAAPVLPLVAGTKQNRGRPATQWARILRARPGPVALGTRGNGGEEASRPTRRDHAETYDAGLFPDWLVTLAWTNPLTGHTACA